MAKNVAARQQTKWTVISIAPDVCKTPMGSSIPPVPYPVTAELDTSAGVATSVRANGHPLVVYKRSFTPKTIGDEAGKARGVKSGTVEGKCHPLEHSSSVRAERHQLVRHGDLFWMNGS
ncbi:MULTISPECIES: DUF4150 domain-containing protein [Pseudomonas]|uniref:DUF4150 domain-containing protein n=1 Tax=Pseudomonas juntendi TaxID=2666183 RepID=A0A7W2LYW1_9PSED|nr:MULTISPECIES: DUF4150 domain-containing protein [Pseudomonas]MBA6134225.1 DUF4150 domain-containing protein [Pseudomonas juntendi]MBA6149583.1 DUF4150 domain-containing protein [Pseudomonas juntendi]MCK2110119.1 DUF4150 domain-containing protein [Pseudomonas juntendi]MCK2114038.1 DUF4150 domain-containing protein [Pseudomonas juntendi]MDG9809837.1 DUF4150 domain-containing protein [Pseudomonas juntendi]